MIDWLSDAVDVGSRVSESVSDLEIDVVELDESDEVTLNVIEGVGELVVLTLLVGDTDPCVKEREDEAVRDSEGVFDDEVVGVVEAESVVDSELDMVEDDVLVKDKDIVCVGDDVSEVEDDSVVEAVGETVGVTEVLRLQVSDIEPEVEAVREVERV